MIQSSINNRFLLLSLKHLKEEWKRQAILTGFIILIFAISLRIIVAAYMTGAMAYEQDPELANFIAIIGDMGLMFLCFVVLSYQTAHSMPFMESKQKHIQYNLLPASKKDKFLSVLFIPLAITIVQCLVAMPIADLLQYLWSGEFAMPIFANASFELPERVKDFPELYDHAANRPHIMWHIFIPGLLYHAWSLFSASYFRKHPFLLSMLTFFVGSAIISYIIRIPIGYLQVIMESDFIGITSEINFCISIALTIVFYALAYRRMSRAQV